MKHIEYYEADDGTRFDDKWDCEAYESNKEFTDIDEHLKILDENFIPVKIGGIDDDNWQNKAEYFIIYSDRGFDYLFKCEDWTGLRLVRKPCPYPEYPLILQYDECNICGINIKHERNKWNDLYNRLKEAI